jgi:riboflavin synthase
MFTGLVLESAPVHKTAEIAGGLRRLEILSQLPEAAAWSLGASISINGCCLTVVSNEPAAQGRVLAFEVSPESLDRTNLASLKSQDLVHLEAALRMGDALGGHVVSGHVDGLGLVHQVEQVGDCLQLTFSLNDRARKDVGPYLVPKGSICVDGVSLTVNGVRDIENTSFFDVMLIPHTLKVTRFATLKVGDKVNLEADILAKYAERKQKFELTSRPPENLAEGIYV